LAVASAGFNSAAEGAAGIEGFPGLAISFGLAGSSSGGFSGRGVGGGSLTSGTDGGEGGAWPCCCSAGGGVGVCWASRAHPVGNARRTANRPIGIGRGLNMDFILRSDL